MDRTAVLNSYAMPPGMPSYPRGPYRFVSREFFIVTFRTDPAALEALVPEPLTLPKDPLAKFEVIRMPDSQGFGSYTESGIVIPVEYQGKPGGFCAFMFLDDDPPIAAGREIWGFPKKYAHPSLSVVKETLTGHLHYGDTMVATSTMAYKYHPLDPAVVEASMSGDNYNLKIIPSVSGGQDVVQLVRYRLQDLKVHWAYQSPAALEFFAHAMAPLAKVPVREVLYGTHLLSDLTLPYGEVVVDYLAEARAPTRA